jgi:hypothetical protein
VVQERPDMAGHVSGRGSPRYVDRRTGYGIVQKGVVLLSEVEEKEGDAIVEGMDKGVDFEKREDRGWRQCAPVLETAQLLEDLVTLR